LTTANALDLGRLSNAYRKAKQRFDEDEAETARQEVVQLQAGAIRDGLGYCEQSQSFSDL